MRIRSEKAAAWPLAILLSGVLAISGCAQFDDTTTQEWQPAPELTPEAGPEPQLPENQGTDKGPAGPPPPAQGPVQPPDGCTDYHEEVVATCLDTVSAIAALPGEESNIGALAAERKSGRVMQVAHRTDPSEFGQLEVEAASDGGLTGLALSPTYQEDQLVFAYVTTANDNRVVRLARGEEPKPVLTGIPKGSSGNRGALTTDGNGALVVATGNAGDPASAADPNSLAGKVLRINPAGEPAKGNPRPDSPVLTTGLRAPGGLCASSDGSRLWVTDRGQDRDALYRVQPGRPLTSAAWTWPDQPGVAGCADAGSMIMVAAATSGNMQNVSIAQDGAVTGKPQTTLNDQSGYGRLAGLDMNTPELAIAGTVNKDGGQPVSSDDRVVAIVPQQGKQGNGKD